MEDSESRPPSDLADDSELDAEGEEVDEEYEQTVTQSLLERSRLKPIPGPDEDTSTRNTDDDEKEESSDSESTATDTSTDSGDNEWQEESEAEEEADAKTVDSHLCMYVSFSLALSFCCRNVSITHIY